MAELDARPDNMEKESKRKLTRLFSANKNEKQSKKRKKKKKHS